MGNDDGTMFVDSDPGVHIVDNGGSVDFDETQEVVNHGLWPDVVEKHPSVFVVDVDAGTFEGYIDGSNVVINGFFEYHLFVDQAVDCGDGLGCHEVGHDRQQQEN